MCRSSCCMLSLCVFLNVFFVVAYCSPYSRPGDRLLRLLAMTGEAVCLCVAALTLLRCRDVVSTICSDLGYQKEQTDKVTACVQASGLANCTVSSMSESKLMVKNVYFCLPFRLTCVAKMKGAHLGVLWNAIQKLQVVVSYSPDSSLLTHLVRIQCAALPDQHIPFERGAR